MGLSQQDQNVFSCKYLSTRPKGLQMRITQKKTIHSCTLNTYDMTNILDIFSAPVLYCYVCDDCPEKKLEPLRHMRACPDESHVSCIVSLTTFGEHKSKFN